MNTVSKDNLSMSDKSESANNDVAGSVSEVPNTVSKLDGSTSVADGSTSVADGSKSVEDGSKSVADGSTSVADGSTSVADGSTSVADGSTSVEDGSKSVADGYVSDESKPITNSDSVLDKKVRNNKKKLKRRIQTCLLSDGSDSDSDWVPGSNSTSNESDEGESYEGESDEGESDEGESDEDIQLSTSDYIKKDNQKLKHIMEILKLDKYYESVIEDGTIVSDVNMYNEKELIEKGMKKMEARRFIMRTSEISRFA